MKKNKRQGFTLIELLAVITILGILMLIAIPAVSKTIENSRKNTFASISKQYITSVRNAVMADQLMCNTDVGTINVGNISDGTYYFKINTDQSSSKYSQTEGIQEKVGKSPWGGGNLQGYVKWVKEGDKTKYYVFLSDKAKHGLGSETEENKVARSEIKNNTYYSATNSDSSSLASPSSGYECYLPTTD